MTQPIQEIKKKRESGIIPGLAKGVLGLVVKPVTGVLDYFAKFADGIKNTVKSDDLNQSRSRPIRAFYGQYQHLRDYSEEDSIFVSFHGKHNENTKLIDTVSGFKIGGNEAADGFMGVTENGVTVIMNRKPLFGIAVKNL